MTKFKRFVLKSLPSKDFPQDLSCFELIQRNLEDLKVQKGFAIIKIVWVSLDPILRTWISGARSYLDPVGPGSGVPGFGIAKVVSLSKNEKKKTFLEVGDWCIGMLQWSEYVKIDYTLVQKIPLDNGAQTYKFLTVYGPTGLTSFLSIKRQIDTFSIVNPKTGKAKSKQEMNIVISSVAGGVGLTAVQYLRKFGYRRIFGIAGSDQKCRVAQEMGCLGTVNYKLFYEKQEFKAKDFEKAIREMLGGDTIDIYYQNVGQEMLSSMLKLMRDNSKIILCGATATYNNWNRKAGILNYENIISKRIQLKGILYYGLSPQERMDAFMEMGAMDMKGRDTIIKGIEQLPLVYRDMINGKYIGKPLVQLSELELDKSSESE